MEGRWALFIWPFWQYMMQYRDAACITSASCCQCSCQIVLTKPGLCSFSVIVCESNTMSEAEVMEAPRARSFLESSCGAGNSAASLDDVDVAKYVLALDTTVSRAQNELFCLELSPRMLKQTVPLETQSLVLRTMFFSFVFFSESSEDESTGEREEEVGACSEITNSTKTPNTQTGAGWRKANC